MKFKKFSGLVLIVLAVIIEILSTPWLGCKKICMCLPNCPDVCTTPFWSSCTLIGMSIAIILLITGILLIRKSKSKNKKR